MASQVVPSTMVWRTTRWDSSSASFLESVDTNVFALQAPVGIENLKVSDKSTTTRKAAFTEADKENLAVAVPIVGIPDIDDEDDDNSKEVSTAATIKKEEQDEPLLQENPQRFVLFPIKYHEVRV